MRKAILFIGFLVLGSCSCLVARDWIVTNYTPFDLNLSIQTGAGFQTRFLAPGSTYNFKSKWECHGFRINKAKVASRTNSKWSDTSDKKPLWQELGKNWKVSKHFYIFCIPTLVKRAVSGGTVDALESVRFGVFANVREDSKQDRVTYFDQNQLEKNKGNLIGYWE